MLCGFISVQFSCLNEKELFLKGVDLESMGLVVTNLVPPTVKTKCVTSLKEPVLNVNQDGLEYCAKQVLF